jgi:hypothetical protein
MQDVSMRMDISSFIAARLDEDEATAHAWLPFGNPDAAAREHIARQDPARVLRGVAAKRAIIEHCERAVEQQGIAMEDGQEALAEWVLAELAAVWSGHPDYRQEWKP